MTRTKRSLERCTLLYIAFCFVRWKLGLPSKWSNTETLPGMGHFADILAVKKNPQEVKQEHLYRTEQGDCQPWPHLWPGLGLALRSLKSWGNSKGAMLCGMWKWSGNFIFICKHWDQPGLCICATSWLHSFRNGGAEQLGQKTRGPRG